MTTTQVYLGIGSNIDRETNIRACLDELKSRYGELRVSPVYESKAFGFEGDDFYNLVVGFNTELGIDDLETQLREIEYQFGRKQNETHYSSRTLDIDLLLYGDLVCDKHELPRVDITKYAFVLKPLCDLDPDLIHPVVGETISSLWKNFNIKEQTLNKIKLSIY
jgi:2-amino-4-hydroxy-6-hydroxymethyldihydropteridine diphosphokinase